MTQRYADGRGGGNIHAGGGESCGRVWGTGMRGWFVFSKPFLTCGINVCLEPSFMSVHECAKPGNVVRERDRTHV